MSGRKETTDRPEHPSGWGPLVQGVCPSCALASLFLGHGGYVTCANLSCPDPGAATDVLEHPPLTGTKIPPGVDR